MSKWIQFQEYETKGVTKAWTIFPKDAERCLGVIRWFPAWRRYSFQPQPNTVFEQDCLRDIANFIEEQTAIRKEERKAEKL